MISDGKVFPARNLGVGEQWGREVESRVHSITREQAQLAHGYATRSGQRRRARLP